MMIKYSFALILLFALAACGSDEIFVEDESTAQSTIKADSTYGDTPQVIGDVFVINEARIINQNLEVDVSYAGGCESHTFELIWPEAILTVYPYQFAFYLSHQANGDTCEAWVSEKLIIELVDNPLGLSYRSLQEAELTIINAHDNTNMVEVEN